MRSRRFLAILSISLLAATALAVGAGRKTLRLSIGNTGDQGNGASGSMTDAPALSLDGSVAAFVSEATDLEVLEPPMQAVVDLNDIQDVFVRDLRLGVNVRASVGLGGAPADGPSRHPVVSRDGRYVVFESDATNLVLGDTNGVTDIFWRDMLLGVTARVSVRNGGGQADGPSRAPSANGVARTIAFESDATNLTLGDTNGHTDVFVASMLALVPGEQPLPVEPLLSVEMASRGLGGAPANGGSYRPSVPSSFPWGIAFESDAINLVEGDTNGHRDVFVWSQDDHDITRVSGRSGFGQSNGPSGHASISDAFRVVFETLATNLGPEPDLNGASDIMMWDVRSSTQLLRISTGFDGGPAIGSSTSPAIAGNGRAIAFVSDAQNISPDDRHAGPDIFLAGLDGLPAVLVSGGSAKVDGSSYPPAISTDGSTIAYASDATNLVAGDTNGVRDVFAFVDESRCFGIGAEDGPASGPIHDAEPGTGRAETLVHQLNCGLLAPRGL